MSETGGLRTRFSPIIVGLAAIAVLVLGTEGYLLLRPHRRAVSAAEEPVTAADSEQRSRAAPPAPASSVRPLPTASAPAAPAPPPPPPEAPQPPIAAGGEPPPLEVQSAAVKKRALLMGDHSQRVTLEADERAFDTLQLPDATRAAIRQINGSYVKTTRDAIEANAAAWSPGEQLGANLAKNDEADRARRAALKEVLGADGVSAFETAEYTAARRLRRQYSAQWAQEIEQQAPLPPGLPPSPH